jgi:hypothetical protein
VQGLLVVEVNTQVCRVATTITQLGAGGIGPVRALSSHSRLRLAHPCALWVVSPGWVAFEAAGADSRQSVSESGLTPGVRTQGRTWRLAQFETVPTGMGIPFLEALDEACRQMMNYTSVFGRLSNVVV